MSNKTMTKESAVNNAASSSKTKSRTNISNAVRTAGRSDVTAYFERSGIRYGNRLKHNPFIVFNEDDGLEVEIVDNAKDLVSYPNSTKVMAQWGGRNRSDFFQFTVGQLKTHIKQNPMRPTEVL